jgi:hypothetical protein
VRVENVVDTGQYSQSDFNIHAEVYQQAAVFVCIMARDNYLIDVEFGDQSRNVCESSKYRMTRKNTRHVKALNNINEANYVNAST